MKVQTQLVK